LLNQWCLILCLNASAKNRPTFVASEKTATESGDWGPPQQYQDGQLRTLQRRVSEWRESMARKLIFGEADQINEVSAIAIEKAPPPEA
jgi:hypothetical protein